ncbi:cupin domain-containing protein [Pseudomonas sp. EpS/L25]|uniref:cupin domain-containing protein n=1 Tax=Pseudomonas sp. EpS/L25 TaxID=1749078 RepID=UPI000744195E|nr:hypothetical protein [Pseudomonas sp. EpS/L25]KUM42600.1 cupin [Pseudomonas sp. EpS/L25]
MDKATFLAQLAHDGFQPPVLVEREPHDRLDVHSHPFEARALVIDGELWLRTAEGEQLYQAGDIFHLGAHEPHTEGFGPEGVRYLAGRRSA